MRFSLILLFIFIQSSLGELRVGVPSDVYSDYLKFLKGRNPIEINNYKGTHSRRDVVEMVFLQKAIHLSGSKVKIQFVTAATYERLVFDLRNDKLDMLGTSVWAEDLSEDERGPVLIKSNEFEAGIFTAPDNEFAINEIKNNRFENLKGVTSKSWKQDWRLLSSLGLKELYNTNIWYSMAKLVSSKRYDILLAGIPNNDSLMITGKGFKLKAVDGYKVSFDGQRVVGISKRVSLAHKNAIEKGITILRKKGEIKRAYEDSGFFSSKAKGWKNLNR